MLKFLVHSTVLVRCDSDRLVSGSSLYPKAKFSFSSDWDTLDKVIQFTRLEDALTISVTLPAEGVISVPAEMVTEPGEFTLAVQGRDNTGTVIANTPLLESTIEVVENGIRDGAAPGMPTPDLYARFVSQLEENNQTVQELLEKAESGEFIGPIGPQGPQGEPGEQGVQGPQGESGVYVGTTEPIEENVAVWINPNGAGSQPDKDNMLQPILNVRDSNGNWFAVPAIQGEQGADGISPTVTVSDITGGHRIIITDASGDHAYDVMDATESDTGWISPEQYLGKRYRKIGNRVTVQFTTGSGVYLSEGGEVRALYQPLPVGFRPSDTFCFLGYSKNNNEMAVVFTVDSGGVVKAKRAPWETAPQHQIQGCEFSFLI